MTGTVEAYGAGAWCLSVPVPGSHRRRGPAHHDRSPHRSNARRHRHRALCGRCPGRGGGAVSVAHPVRRAAVRAVRHQGPDVRRGLEAVAGLHRPAARRGHARGRVRRLAGRPAVRQRRLRLVPRRCRQAVRREDHDGHQCHRRRGPGTRRGRRARRCRRQRGRLAEVRSERGRRLGLQPGLAQRRQLHLDRDRRPGQAGRAARRCDDQGRQDAVRRAARAGDPVRRQGRRRVRVPARQGRQARRQRGRHRGRRARFNGQGACRLEQFRVREQGAHLPQGRRRQARAGRPERCPLSRGRPREDRPPEPAADAGRHRHHRAARLRQHRGRGRRPGRRGPPGQGGRRARLAEEERRALGGRERPRRLRPVGRGRPHDRRRCPRLRRCRPGRAAERDRTEAAAVHTPSPATSDYAAQDGTSDDAGLGVWWLVGIGLAAGAGVGFLISSRRKTPQL